LVQFRERFSSQLRLRTAQIVQDYFSGDDRPGLRLYQEYLTENVDFDLEQARAERNRARRLLSALIFR
jgi:hypothetical protein